MLLDYRVLTLDYAVAYGSVTLKSLQNDNIPELDLLVRESIQNSSDASLKEPGKNFKVAFTTGKFVPKDFNSLITGLEDKLNRSFSQEKADFMEIRDTKTSGLTGSIRKSEITDDDHGNFFKLIYDTGKNQTQKGAGGNWGFGKSVYYRVGIGMVVFYSRVRLDDDSYESRLIVTVVENESKKDKDGRDATLLRSLDPRSQGKAWWGIKDGDDLLPVTDSEFIDAVLETFNLKPFEDNETGTSIIIPYIDNKRLLGDIIPSESAIKDDVKNAFMSLWGNRVSDYLELAIQKWYAPKIHNRKLTEICNDKKWLYVSVNDKPIRKNNLIPFFNLVQELYNAALAKNEHVEYQCDIPSDVKCYPVNIRGYLNGSLTGHVAVTRITKEELNGERLMLSPYDYVGRFEADGGINEPIVMYAREPGMVIDYPVAGPWIKGITPPESESEFLFAFYVPDTDMKIKSDLAVKEFAGMTLGDYLRSCEASDHMSWIDPAKMKIVERIQRITVKRIEEQRTTVDGKTIEATASHLSGKLGRLFMPRKGYGKQSSQQNGGSGSGSGIRLNNLEFIINSTQFHNNLLEMSFVLKFKHNNKKAKLFLIVESEGGNISPSAWQKEIETPFPAEITEVVVSSINSPVFLEPITVNGICNSSEPKYSGEYCTVLINRAENSKEYTMIIIDSNIFNLELSGKIRIQAQDKKYRFSFRTV